jgi:hypothetical protein
MTDNRSGFNPTKTKNIVGWVKLNKNKKGKENGD